MKNNIFAGIVFLALLGSSQVGYSQVSTASVTKMMLDLPNNPLPNVEIGMTLAEFISSHPRARAGMFGKSIDLNKANQTVFEAIHSYGGEETALYYFTNSTLSAVDYSIALENDNDYKVILKKIVQHYRGKRGKEHQRHVLSEEWKKSTLVGYLQWNSDAMDVGVEFSPSDSSAKRKAVILVRLAPSSSKVNLATFAKKRKSVDAPAMTKLLKDAD